MPQLPDSPWFVVAWDEGPTDNGYALYRRVGSSKLCWVLNELGERERHLDSLTLDWHRSCRFLPLDRAAADTCLAVVALSPAAWPAYARNLFEDCKHG